MDLLRYHSRTSVILALQFFDRVMKKGARKQPPALGLHLVMGASMPQKIQNIQHQIRQGVLAPLVITASRELASEGFRS